MNIRYEVFASFTHGRKVLLSERNDGSGWTLPGGSREPGETDEMALRRNMREKTGLEIETFHPVGTGYLVHDTVSRLYACRPANGHIATSRDIRQHRYVDEEELRQGFYQATTFINNTLCQVPAPLKLAGPDDKLSTNGRMVWDTLSLLEDPLTDTLPFHVPHFFILSMRRIARKLTENTYTPVGNCFFSRSGLRFLCWPRLDPYAQNGVMEPIANVS